MEKPHFLCWWFSFFLSLVYYMASVFSDCILLKGGWLINNELKKIWKDAVWPDWGAILISVWRDNVSAEIKTNYISNTSPQLIAMPAYLMLWLFDVCVCIHVFFSTTILYATATFQKSRFYASLEMMLMEGEKQWSCLENDAVHALEQLD